MIRRIHDAGLTARLGVLLIAAALAGPSPWAHDMWIQPSTFRPEPGATVKIGLRVGHAGASQAVVRDSRRIVRFDLVAAGGTTAVPGLDGSRTAGLVRPTDAGAYALVYVGDDAFIQLEAEHFEAYLAEEGLEDVSDERDWRGESELPGRERYSRALKCLLTIGEPGQLRDRTIGLPLELVLESPLTRPTLGVRIVHRGEALAGTLVDAVDLETGQVETSLRSDDDGRVTFDLHAGRWMLAAVHMTRDTGERADWKSIWTATTFELP